LADRLRRASLPTAATLAGFDVDAAAGVDRKLIDELATCRYLESATNMPFTGEQFHRARLSTFERHQPDPAGPTPIWLTTPPAYR